MRRRYFADFTYHGGGSGTPAIGGHSLFTVFKYKQSYDGKNGSRTNTWSYLAKNHQDIFCREMFTEYLWDGVSSVSVLFCINKAVNLSFLMSSGQKRCLRNTTRCGCFVLQLQEREQTEAGEGKTVWHCCNASENKN